MTIAVDLGRKATKQTKNFIIIFGPHRENLILLLANKKTQNAVG